MQNIKRCILSWCCLCLLSLSVIAQTPPVEPSSSPSSTPDPANKTAASPASTPEVILEFGALYEHLSNNNPDWQTYFFRFNRKFSSAQLLYGEVSAVRRFNQTDSNFIVGWFQPLNESKRWFASVEVAGSPTHDVLPAFSFFGELGRNFGSGWVGHAGFRHSHYSDDNVNMGVFNVEKYFKAYRGAYTAYVAHLNGAGTSVSHSFQGNYYYGERNSVGLGFAFGQEIESVGNGKFIRSDVREVNLSGKHWFNPRWGMSYLALWHRQGDFYTRSSAQLALLLRF